MAKKLPMRMCVACREMRSKKELLRVVRCASADAAETELPQVCIDRTGKKNGRGAYICANTNCFEKAQKTRALERALNCRLDEAFYAHLSEELQGEE